MNQRGKDKRLNLVLEALLKFAGRDRELWSSTREIAAEVGISRRTAKSYIDALQARGVLVLKYPANSTGGQFANDNPEDDCMPTRWPATYVLGQRAYHAFKKSIA